MFSDETKKGGKACLNLTQVMTFAGRADGYLFLPRPDRLWVLGIFGSFLMWPGKMGAALSYLYI